MPRILITGATGNTGKAVLQYLQKLSNPSLHLVAGVRDPTASSSTSLGVELVKLDASVPESLDSAFAGVDKTFLVAPNAENRADIIASYIDAAKRNQVKHVVLLSVPGAELELILFARQFRKMEVHLENSGLNYTHVQCFFFTDNLIGSAGDIKNGTLHYQLKDGKFPPITVSDIGKTVATILASQGSEHFNKKYVLSGPEAVSGGDIAARFSEALGKPIQYVNIPGEASLQAFLGLGFPHWQAVGLVELMDVLANNYASQVSPDVQNITGAPGTTVAQWIAEHLAFFQ